jgi:predicted extracellular nuclease
MRLVALLLIALVSWSAHAQPETLAYWAQNDNGLPGGGFGFTPDSFPQPADTGALAASAFITLGNFDQTTGGVDNAYTCVPSFGGTTVNALSGVAAGGSLSPTGCTDLTNNGMHIDISLSTAGYESITLSWAQRGTASGFTSRQLSWSADGGTSFTDFGSDTGALGSSFVVQSYDLSGIAAISDAADVVFRITLDGATNASGNNRFDNILVQGEPLGGSQPGDLAEIPYLLQLTTDPYSVGWSVQNVTGAANWAWNSSFGNVSFSSFSGSCQATESWFISPEFDLDAQTGEELFIDIALGFGGDDPLDLLYSTDYDGTGDPNQASWTLIRSVADSEFASTNTPVTFGPFDDLQAAQGTAHIAARGLFESGSCSTWRISRVQITDDAAGAGEFACIADPAADDLVTRIHAIQGDGFTSPLAAAPGQAGELVEVQAVVVGAFQDSAAGQIGGFFVQELDANADANPLTSEGIYISPVQAGISIPAVSIGQEVRIAGAVRENFAQTEIFQLSNFALCNEDRLAEVTPALVSLPVADPIELEAVEGMWVRMPQALTVTEVFNAARFAEFSVAPERLFQPTQVALPGADANAVQAANELSRLIIDQGLSGSYRTPYQPGLDGSPLNASNPIRSGYRLQPDFDGVMGYGFSNYRLFALQPADFDDVDNPRLSAPPAMPEGNLRAVSFNVENLFATIQTGGVGCGPNFLNCRGATTESELARQLIKVTEALLALNADVVGLVEVENDADDATLSLLVDALNAVDPVPDWAYVPTGFMGTDAIKNAIIYRSGTVLPVGATAVLDGSVVVTPPFDDSRQRPTLTQAFEHSNGEVFAVSVFHLRSKNCGSSASGANLDQGDGQGCWNALRTESVQSWLNWIETDPTTTGSRRHLVMGDFNAYGLEDPLRALMDVGYINQAMRFNDDDPAVYSYIFQGQSGSLDHVFASPAMNEQVLDAVSWTINADEIPAFAYPETLPNSSLAKPADFFAEDPFRASDHDPLILSVNLQPEPARVQIAHLAPFADAAGSLVDIAVDGEVVLTEVAYGDSTPYLPLGPGLVDIDITPAGAMAPAISVSVELESALYYTAIASGDGVNQPLALIALADDLSEPAAGQFKLRLGHLAPFAAGSATAEVRTSAGDLVTTLNHAEVDGFIELPAGSYDLAITAPGGEPVLIDPVAVDFADGDIISVFATGDGDNQRLGVFALPAGGEGFFADLNAGIELDNLVQTYTGDALEIGVSTVPADLAVEVLYAGSTLAPTDAGSYPVEVTVVEPGYVGSASASLIIEPAEAGISFSGLTQLVTGDPLSPMVTTDPADLAVILSFDGQAGAPSAVGDYIVQAVIDEPNYSGSASAIFRILDASARSLVIVQQPGGNNVIGQVLSPPLVVELRNEADAVVVDDNETVIELVLLAPADPGTSSTSSRAVLTSATVTDGVAVFDQLVIGIEGSGYRLLVQDADEALPLVLGAPFDVLGDVIFINRFE